MPHRTCGGRWRKLAATESVTENKPPGATSVRVKRRGKSSPPGAQAPGHDKPHAVQDKTGSWVACRILPGNSRTGRKTGSLLREREINGHPACGNTGRQNSAYSRPKRALLGKPGSARLFGAAPCANLKLRSKKILFPHISAFKIRCSCNDKLLLLEESTLPQIVHMLLEFAQTIYARGVGTLLCMSNSIFHPFGDVRRSIDCVGKICRHGD